MILAGDVGGTKVHLALCNFDHGKLVIVHDQKFPAHQFGTLKDVVDAFFKDPEAEKKVDGEITAACFGCPGPIVNGRIQLTNLPWLLDAKLLSEQLNIQHLFLINDVEANGYGIAELPPESIETLVKGEDAAGHRALLSAGTGLGLAQIAYDAETKKYRPLPSEGGHVDFAARTPLEIELLQSLQKKYNGRISTERVVSGLGLANIYGFLRDEKKMDEPEWLRARMAKEDPNAVIGTCAEDGSSELCKKTLEMFCAAYGAASGNLALMLLAAGGVYLGGGIAPKILKTLKTGAFRDAFLDKGRLSPLLHTIPVRVILEQRTALFGAAAYAETRSAELTGQSERGASQA